MYRYAERGLSFRQTPRYGPQTRPIGRNRRLPSRRSGAQETNGNTPVRRCTPQNSIRTPLRGHRNPPSLRSEVFRRFALPVFGRLRSRKKFRPGDLPRTRTATSCLPGPPVKNGRKRISERNAETETHRNEKTHGKDRSASYSRNGRFRRSDADPPFETERVRRRTEEKPETTALRPDAFARKANGDMSVPKAGTKLTAKNGLILSRTVLGEGDSISRHAERPYLLPPADVIRSVRIRIGSGREQVRSGNAACDCESRHSNPKTKTGHFGTSTYRSM